MRLFVGVEENYLLSGGAWSNMSIQAVDVFVEGGKVRMDITPTGNAAFYRVQGGTDE